MRVRLIYRRQLTRQEETALLSQGVGVRSEGSGQGSTRPVIEESVRAAQRGDTAAFELLVRRHADPLYRFLVMNVGDPSDAKDALQETLVAAWKGLPGLRDPSRFWSWLVGISIHKCADVHRRRRNGEGSPRTDVQVDGGFGVTDVDLVLQSLPPALRDVLLLRYLVGLSERETARVLGTNVGTVKSRSARARARLLESLQVDG